MNIENQSNKMTNDELNQAIDTAAKHSAGGYGETERARLMRRHLKLLLGVQLMRAGYDKKLIETYAVEKA